MDAEAYSVIFFVLICLIVTVFNVGIPILRLYYDKKYRRELIEKNKKTENEQKKIAYLKGAEKGHYLSGKAYKDHRAGIEAMVTLGAIIPNSVTVEKERDWAAWGGAASGLAGPAAGVATALNVMKENEEIHQRNAERKAWAQKEGEKFQKMAVEAALSTPDFKSVYDKKVTASEEEDVNSLFSKLKLNSEKTNIEKDSGSVTVYATFDVKCKRGEIIDGSIKAVLYNKKGEEAGCAYLYLPVSGTAGEKSISMNGMCAEPKKYGPYTVKFEPINLWKVKKA